jgi:hypothetical protein
MIASKCLKNKRADKRILRKPISFSWQTVLSLEKKRYRHIWNPSRPVYYVYYLVASFGLLVMSINKFQTYLPLKVHIHISTLLSKVFPLFRLQDP